MSKIFTTIIFLFMLQIAVGQQKNIHKINTKESVETLIHSFDKRYENFKLKPIGEFKSRYSKTNSCKRISDALNITKSFYKSDFDSNGHTDILAIGEYYDFNIFVVMNFGNDSLQLKRLTRRSFQNCVFPKIINDSLIDYYYKSESNWISKEKPELTKTTLTYKFNDFIEFNANPKQYDIKKIEYQTTMCFGTCPKFKIEINNTRSAIFNAENHNKRTRDSKEVQGEFKTIIDENSYSEIIDVLNYIDFPNLKDKYAVNWTDDQSCTLKITYNDGKIKEINDYGLIGTYGLDRLYQLFFELRFNQNWKK